MEGRPKDVGKCPGRPNVSDRDNYGTRGRFTTPNLLETWTKYDAVVTVPFEPSFRPAVLPYGWGLGKRKLRSETNKRGQCFFGSRLYSCFVWRDHRYKLSFGKDSLVSGDASTEVSRKLNKPHLRPVPEK